MFLQTELVSKAVDAVSEVNPDLGLVLWLMLAVIALTVISTLFVVKIRNHGSKIRKHEIEIDTLKDMRESMVRIESFLCGKYPTASTVFSMKKSPRKLNKVGEDLLKDIDGKTFISNNKEFFFKIINEREPKTALDVENNAYIACVSSTNEGIFNGLKNFVYNSPSMTIKDENGNESSYDLTMNDVCFVLGLYLRDIYLDAHKEIEIE